MTHNPSETDPASWNLALDAVAAAPKHHKVLFENEQLRVLEVTLEPNDEEPVHHHRWPSVFVFDSIKGPIHDFAPDGSQLPDNRDVIKAVQGWNGQGLFGREYVTAASRAGLKRIGQNPTRYPHRDENHPVIRGVVVKDATSFSICYVYAPRDEALRGSYMTYRGKSLSLRHYGQRRAHAQTEDYKQPQGVGSAKA